MLSCAAFQCFFLVTVIIVSITCEHGCQFCIHIVSCLVCFVLFVYYKCLVGVHVCWGFTSNEYYFLLLLKFTGKKANVLVGITCLILTSE